MEVRFTTSARKHRIGKAHVLHVLENHEPTVEPHPEGERHTWIAPDDRGMELEIVGLKLESYLLIIHVMPFRFRRRK